MNHLLRQVNITSMAAIYLPRKISGDEMSINFGGKEILKIKEGCHTEAICCNSYTYIFNFHHQLYPTNYRTLTFILLPLFL